MSLAGCVGSIGSPFAADERDGARPRRDGGALVGGEDGGDRPADAARPDATVLDGGFVVDPDSLRARASVDVPVIGAAVDMDALEAEAVYRETLGREYNSVTPENAMKWDAVQPGPDAWDFARADALVDFAGAHAQSVHGHALVWHEQLPSWVSDALGAENLRAAMRERISRTVTRYRGRVARWDVVNEAIGDDNGLRDSVFSRLLGRGFVAEAFEAARASDPEAVLLYNDYNVEVPGPKQDAVYELVAELVRAGAPIDAVGFQLHLGSPFAASAYSFATGRVGVDVLRASIRRFADLGLEVYITELDVRVADLDGSVDRFAVQRDVYHAVASACHAEPACKGVTTWGFTDAHSWIDGHFGADDPLPFDDGYARKPAYFGLRAGLEGEPAPPITIDWDSACGSAITGARFCDPMESPTLAPFYRSLVGGTVESVTSPRYRGGRAFRASTPAIAGPQALIGQPVWTGRRSGSQWARAYVYLPSSASVTGLTLMSFNEPDPPYLGVGINIAASGRLQLAATTVSAFPESGAVLRRDAWTCLVLGVDVGDAGRARIVVDGVTVLDQSVDTLPDGGYGNINFGIEYVGPGSSAVEVWFDEVAVSDSPLGCD